MHRSIATVSLSGTLRQKLEAIAAAGFNGIELFEADFINFNGTAADLGRVAADLGLSIDLYQPFRDFEAMPEPQFRRSLDRAERKFDLMQAMGAPLVLCCSNTSPLTIDDPALAGRNCMSWPSAPAAAACASASRRWPGAARLRFTARPGTSCVAPTIRASA